MTPITIGTSPAGVEWVAYHREHVAPMRERLGRLWTARRRRVLLTPAQSAVVGDVLTVLKETTDCSRAVARETYVEAPQLVLEAIADRVEGEAASVADVGVYIDGAHTEAQAEFAVRSRLNSLRKLARKLRGRR